MTAPSSLAMQVALVFGGAALGGVLRYGMGSLFQRFVRGRFPWGTFVINVTGCFVMGALMHLHSDQGRLNGDHRLFYIVGILGGYTTFSTYGYEAEALLRNREGAIAFAYAAGSVVLGLAAVWAGRWCVQVCGI
jgi:CrcB protein